MHHREWRSETVFGEISNPPPYHFRADEKVESCPWVNSWCPWREEHLVSVRGHTVEVFMRGHLVPLRGGLSTHHHFGERLELPPLRHSDPETLSPGKRSIPQKAREHAPAFRRGGGGRWTRGCAAAAAPPHSGGVCSDELLAMERLPAFRV